MKRAEVGRVHDRKPDGEWYYDIFDGPVDPDDAGVPLSKREVPTATIAGERRHTHEAALAAALAEVGLTSSNREPMETR